MNSSSWVEQPLGYSTIESLLEEVSHNMSASTVTRQSRGSIGQKPAPMRVVKPSSANNSPRNSIGLGRRMTDGAYRRRLAMLEQGSREAALANQPSLQSSRPVSWHPVTQVPYMAYNQYVTPINTNYPVFDYQQSPATFSGFNSPSSTFSPMSGNPPTYNTSQYMINNRHSYHPPSYALHQTSTLPVQDMPRTSSNNADPTMYSHFDWSNFAANGFEDPSTTPPTPENFLPIQHPEPTFQAEDAIPFQTLDDSDDGEELIGMGLYDTPELKSPPSDPHLDNYRALMLSQLFGTGYRRPEPTGKGLKLEETWAPPASEDGEDSDQDGEAEEEEETVAQAENVVQHVGVNHDVVENLNQGPTSVETYNREGWL